MSRPFINNKWHFAQGMALGCVIAAAILWALPNSPAVVAGALGVVGTALLATAELLEGEL